jgi:L-alanine-DL-glutamate epimerase-like enolase superfamily enzyme
VKIERCAVMPVGVNFEGIMPGTHIVLRLRTADGIEGISYVSRVGPTTMKPLALLIEAMADSLRGQDLTNGEAIYAQLFRGMLGAPLSGLELRAASAIDVACWDIRGKALGQPVHKLMGGYRDRLPISANWRLMPGGKPDELATHIADLIDRGFRALKCPVGFAPLDNAIAHVKFVRECAGPGVKIIVDGNFQWTVKQALRFARETEETDLYWIEDPVPHHDYPGMHTVTEAAKQTICAGEVYQHPHQFRWLLEGRCSDIVMIDQDLGLTGFLKIAHMAEVYGAPVVNHLAPEVLSHAIAAIPNGLIVGLVPWGQPLFTEPMKVEDGDLIMPTAPGLGLTLDEDVLKFCRLD